MGHTKLIIYNNVMYIIVERNDNKSNWLNIPPDCVFFTLYTSIKTSWPHQVIN